jgi:MarR family transcriptional regulator, lower aerobic nicotinate degradation pathway regulator
MSGERPASLSTGLDRYLSEPDSLSATVIVADSVLGVNAELSPGGLRNGPGFLLSRVGTAVQSGFKDVVSGWGIRPLQFLVLVALQSRPGSSQQELCRALNIDSGNMVELIDALENLGYVVRATDPQDRRRRVVEITETGRVALAEMHKAAADFDSEFLSPLNAAERKQLVQLLAKLYAATGEGRGEGYVSIAPGR